MVIRVHFGKEEANRVVKFSFGDSFFCLFAQSTQSFIEYILEGLVAIESEILDYNSLSQQHTICPFFENLGSDKLVKKSLNHLPIIMRCNQLSREGIQNTFS